MIHRQNHRRQRGDTLVEVAIALAIITSTIGSITVLAGAAYRLGEAARQRVEVAALMQQEAEILRNLRDDDIANDPVGGWNTFLSGTNPVSGFPCQANSTAGTSYTVAPPATIASGNTWAGVGIPYKISYTITTQQGIYKLATTVCDLNTDSPADDIRVMIQVNWTSVNGVSEQANLDSELVNTSNINELVPAL